MANVAVVSGQFGNGHTSFANSPVIIEVSNLAWPTDPVSPFTIVRIEAKYGDAVVGEFRADTGGQTSTRFDISSALRAIWAGYNYTNELAAAAGKSSTTRAYRAFKIAVYTEYMNDGVFTQTGAGTFNAGSCAIGGMTELERSEVGNADMSVLQFSNLRFGDASTKPTSTPERVGKSSITSWVDLDATGTTSHFYANDDGRYDQTSDHAPIVLRDSVDYVDFLFVNRRGAVETCAAQMAEALNIDVKTTTYAHVERPTFAPSRSLTSVSEGGRRSWAMSSGYQTREWAEWWALEFLTAKRWWMLRNGRYIPVVIEPAKQKTPIYDRAKQELPHVDFTTTLALEG